MNYVGGCPGDDVSVEFLDWNVFAQNYYNLNKLWVCIHHPEEKKVCITAVMLKGHSLTLKSSLLIKFCLSSKVSEFCACGFTWNEWMNESNIKNEILSFKLSLISTSLCCWYSSLFPVELCWNDDLVFHNIILNSRHYCVDLSNHYANVKEEEEGIGNSGNTVLMPLITGRQIAECTDCWNDSNV